MRTGLPISLKAHNSQEAVPPFAVHRLDGAEHAAADVNFACRGLLPLRALPAQDPSIPLPTDSYDKTAGLAICTAVEIFTDSMASDAVLARALQHSCRAKARARAVKPLTTGRHADNDGANSGIVTSSVRSEYLGGKRLSGVETSISRGDELTNVHMAAPKQYEYIMSTSPKEQWNQRITTGELSCRPEEGLKAINHRRLAGLRPGRSLQVAGALKVASLGKQGIFTFSTARSADRNSANNVEVAHGFSVWRSGSKLTGRSCVGSGWLMSKRKEKRIIIASTDLS